MEPRGVKGSHVGGAWQELYPLSRGSSLRGGLGISTLALSLPLSFFHLLLGSPLFRPHQKP